MALKHGATPAQVALSWGLSKGASVIAKSFNLERLKENKGALELKLEDDEILEIDSKLKEMKIMRGDVYVNDATSPYKTIQELIARPDRNGVTSSGSAVNDGSAWLDGDNDVDFSAVEFRTAPGGAEAWIFLRQEVNMFTALQKFHQDRDTDPTEFEESVAQALFDVENTNQDIKSELKDLYINSAVQIDVAGGKKAVVIHAPYRLRKAFRKYAPQEGFCCPRPRSRKLTSVHEAVLEDVVYPAEIVRKCIRYRLDGSKIMKVFLDPKSRNDTENKLETFAGVYMKLSGKDRRYQPLAKRFNLRIKERIAEDEGRAANIWVARGREIVSPRSRCEELMGMGWCREDVENLLPKDDVKGTTARKAEKCRLLKNQKLD
ncbi:hypothetical protein SASPL_106904 [Salvia splendens]|uniref:NADP-dependent oxidoreductase domain-containing protein n=1 Tax=Salvia splendens TaxID=180675 RepID=A0A8X8Y9F9_SALSN|nr:hypothetical protein SASPL_106904 [Salvia splendens]